MATKTKQKTALAELEALEVKAEEAHEAVQEVSLRLADSRSRSEEIEGRRLRLIKANPELVSYQGEPVDPDNAAGKLIAERNKIPDPNALAAELEHARLVRERARQRVTEHIAANYAELLEQFRPTAEEVAANLAESMTSTLAMAQLYAGTYNRSTGLAGAAGADTSKVPGHEVHDLIRLIKRWQPPAPIQEDSNGL